jgi:hypothetical protein
MALPLECPRGSGLQCDEETDGYGIFMFFYCRHCYAKKLSGFRPDIFTQYPTDEQIEDDY